MTYSDISLSMYINHCEMSVELPYLRYIVVLLPQKRFFNYFEFDFEFVMKVTRPRFFGGVPSYFEALWYPHLYFYRKSNT